MRFFSSALALLAGSLTPVASVLYGDENYLDIENGRFWAFYSGGIAVIDPETCSVETTITVDGDGSDLPAGWSDGVYMQDHQGQELEGYILINSRINRANSAGDSVSDVYVVDTQQRKVVSVVEVGPRVVHSYGLHTRDQFWTHSDGDGHFYIIRLKDLSSHQGKVVAHQELPFHGKLLWDEDDSLGSRGFATSTGERVLFEVDIAKAEKVRSYDYSSDIVPGTCFGLHAIAYSRINEHVYTECTGGGGTLEFDVSNNDIVFVAQHLSATGALYEVPDGTYAVASNKGGDKLHVFKPNGNGAKSSLQVDVAVPGRPSTPSFFPYDNVNGGADFIACMPLTGNANKNHVGPDGKVACDYYTGCTNATSASDVTSGKCHHTDPGDGTPLQLTRVTEMATDDEACARCTNDANFQSGFCVCTPNCGSCDPEPKIDVSTTGVSCVDLGAVVDGQVTTATLIPNAGAVHQGRPYSSSAECGFGRTYRTHKRGTIYDASVANYPEDSVVIVRMDTQEKHCSVPLAGAPSRVYYAPLEPKLVEGVGLQGESYSGGVIKNPSIFVAAIAGAALFFLA